MAYKFIETRLDSGVLRITLNRPEVLNSFSFAMAKELQAALSEAASDDGVRAVLLTGAGRAFSAGQDLSEALPREGEPIPDIAAIVRANYNPIIIAIRTLEKPVVCAVNGVAAGAGANLAFACDITLAADTATFVESFSKLGLIPDTGGTFFVPRLTGHQRATGMFFLAEKISAATAREWGLIWGVVPAAELDSTAHGLAKSLASRATRGFGLTKRAMNAGFHNSIEAQLEFEAETMSEAGRTDDYVEGVRAFLAKRQPEYRGR